MKLKYYKLHNEVIDPHFATDGSACFDICAYLDNPVTVYRMNNHKEKRNPETIYWTDINKIQLSIGPAERALIPTGLVFDIPEGYSVRLHPRSSISLKRGLVMPNGEGIVDFDYYHETFIMLYNASADEVRITHGERIAQGELIKTLDYSLEESIIVPEQKTNRIGGFGSTGTE